ncbi:MAG: cyclic pyranopterin monophosphate synthase MoaC [Chloroflexi bacterium]|nr:cyclic pyranopterin monophosphate synthase MoaC [Chloroflexota bacterium]MBU1748238.1 cyclic pyranopterin monophosphate synthase MoaC [Chloroflexota bacterium]
MSRLTHVDERGQARMVDVGAKADTDRVAVARGVVCMRRETLDLIRQGALVKGDVLAVARVAGIMAAKRTPELVPLCHPLLLTHVTVDFDLRDEGDNGMIDIRAEVHTVGKTGAEMEALAAVMGAALTIYDMGKAVDRAMRITDVRLVRKAGGKSGDIVLEEDGG